MFLVVTILSVMLWTQCFNAIVRPQKDFDLQRFSGPWYRVGLAYDSPEFVPLKKYLQVSKGNITSDTDGNANLTVRGTGKKGCMCGVYHYKKTDLPGQFTYFSDRHQIWKDVTVVESNYTEYSLVVKYKEIMKNFSQVSLYGRFPTLREEILERFRNYSLLLGFSAESILIPSSIDPCSD
ncbi:lipocalin-15 [Esox lucius]|uniref:lipocalin-15 n=1 Tax=Esox lucius TaxID=8010 RepID=UPI0005772AA0|nr:lipocalin-15 [Esox lucius]